MRYFPRGCTLQCLFYFFIYFFFFFLGGGGEQDNKDLFFGA